MKTSGLNNSAASLQKKLVPKKLTSSGGTLHVDHNSSSGFQGVVGTQIEIKSRDNSIDLSRDSDGVLKNPLASILTSNSNYSSAHKAHK